MFLLSPTEHKLKALAPQLFHVSSVPEKFGSDIWFPNATYGGVGIQRKEISDLIASLHDGRLAKELGQMRQLGLGILLIEGQMKWTLDGNLMGSRTLFTLASYRGLSYSIMASGFWIMTTYNLAESIESMLHLKSWLEKGTHQSLLTRPKAAGIWGSATSREWSIHLLQSFEGVGIKAATAIYEKYGVPMEWTITEKELLSIPGIGKVTAQRLMKALKQPSPDT